MNELSILPLFSSELNQLEVAKPNVLDQMMVKDDLPPSPLFFGLFGEIPHIEFWQQVDDERLVVALKTFIAQYPPQWKRQILGYKSLKMDENPGYVMAYKGGLLIMNQSSYHCQLLYHNPEHPLLAPLRELIAKAVIKPKHENKIYLLSHSQSGLYLAKQSMEPLKGSMWKHYNNDIKPIHRTLIKLMQKPTSGLVLLHGLPGTGKTSFIRKLIEKSKRPVIIVPISMLGILESPSLVELYSKLKNSVMIIEDADDALRKRGNVRSGLVSTLLNFTDGLQAATLNITFICTFNMPIHDLDKALLRPGRLLLRYKFLPLSMEKVQALRPQLSPKNLKPMTLAEVLAQPVIETNAQSSTYAPVGYHA